METSRHRSPKRKSEYLSPGLYEEDQDESSQELKVWAEEQAAEDQLDDGFLN